MIVFKLDDLIWQNKITAKEIAKITGLGKSTISKFRNSKNANVNINTLNELCKYFNCNTQDLIEYVPDK